MEVSGQEIEIALPGDIKMADTIKSPEEEWLINDENKGHIINDEGNQKFNPDCFYKIFPKLLPCIPERYILATLLCSGLCVVYALRVNLSIALVEMVNHTVIVGTGPDANITYQGDFNWSDEEQGWILAAFFYGYLLTQLPGGWLSTYFGGKWVFGLGVFATVILTLITPLVAKVNVWLLVAVRVLEGVGEGVTFPSMLAVWGSWAPPVERSRLLSFSYMGIQLGNIIAFPVSGVICQYLGWSWVFYIFGIGGTIWFIFWTLYAFDKPSNNPRISEKERLYIENSLKNQLTRKKKRTPWFQIWTSLPVWGISISSFCNNWGFYTLLTCMPTFLQETIGLDIRTNGLLSAIPYAVFLVFNMMSGEIADFVRKRWISTGTTRKIFSIGGLFFSGFFLLICGYFGTTIITSIVFLSLGVGLQGMVIAGHNVNNLDIAPRYSGIIMGITNSFGTIPGFLGPQLAKAVARTPPSTIPARSAAYVEIYRKEWINVFWVTAEICLFGMISYGLLADGEVQSWALDAPNDSSEDREQDSEENIN